MSDTAILAGLVVIHLVAWTAAYVIGFWRGRTQGFDEGTTAEREMWIDIYKLPGACRKQDDLPDNVVWLDRGGRRGTGS